MKIPPGPNEAKDYAAMAKNNWKRFNTPETDNAVYYSDRPNGTEMTVTAHPDGTHTIYVYDPETNTEYLDGEIPDATVNDCIARAESVRLPEEDTGI